MAYIEHIWNFSLPDSDEHIYRSLRLSIQSSSNKLSLYALFGIMSSSCYFERVCLAKVSVDHI